jgi:hypothetical protein
VLFAAGVLTFKRFGQDYSEKRAGLGAVGAKLDIPPLSDIFTSKQMFVKSRNKGRSGGQTRL